MTAVRQTVSSPSESLILVDEQDRETGFCSKLECHQGDGLLHRAFSIFLFNADDELLLQQRSGEKPLWPLYWSNSCCSHPRQGETVEEAVRRRVREELALDCTPVFLYKFQYHARFNDVGSERELCWVFAARCNGEVAAHPEEIAAWRWISPAALTEEISADPDSFTPWLKMEWEVIRREYLDAILQKN